MTLGMKMNTTMSMSPQSTMEGMTSPPPLEQVEHQALQGTKIGTRGQTQGMVIITGGSPPVKTDKTGTEMDTTLKEAQAETEEEGQGPIGPICMATENEGVARRF